MGSFATAEELTLLVANNTTGFFGVYHHPGRSKPYEAQVRRGGKMLYLGHFATVEEAALCVARSWEGEEEHGQYAQEEEQEKEQEESFHFAGSKGR